jgi:hypothetical protein
VGGCQLVENQTIWYYPTQAHMTAADVMSACTSLGGTFVSTPEPGP